MITVQYSNDTGNIYNSANIEMLEDIHLDLLNFLCRNRYFVLEGYIDTYHNSFVLSKMYDTMVCFKELNEQSYRKVFEENYPHIKICKYNI